MFGLTQQTRVYLKTGITDMRQGCESLRGLIVKVIHENPTSGHLFCFCNRARNRLRLVWFDGSGFFIATKRLERGTFDFPKNSTGPMRMSVAQLHALLRGVEFTSKGQNGGYRR